MALPVFYNHHQPVPDLLTPMCPAQQANAQQPPPCRPLPQESLPPHRTLRPEPLFGTEFPGHLNLASSHLNAFLLGRICGDKGPSGPLLAEYIDTLERLKYLSGKLQALVTEAERFPLA